jgi:hypothetical protein
MPTHSDALADAILACLREVLPRLAADVPADAGSELLLREYAAAKARLGRKAVAEQLGLGEADLGEFDRALRRGAEAVSAAEDPGREIACLRLLLWFETIWAQALGRSLEVRLPVRSSEDIARKQVRAIELICRALIVEGHEDQPRLVARLRELFRPEIVDKWIKAGSPGDVLSGTTFSELASLFVSEEVFARHQPLFERAAHLTYLGDKRRTLQLFLEDVRRIRNHFAHHKAVSPLQLALLERYFEELSSPVQGAYDRGETKVNPDDYLDASREQLESFFAGVHEDLAAVKGNLAEMRAALEGRLDAIGTDVRETAATTRRVDRRLQLVLGGVAAILILGGGLFLLTRETGRRTESIQADTTRIRADTAVVAQSAQQAAAATTAVQAGAGRLEQQARELGTQAEAMRQEGAETRQVVQQAAQQTAEAVREVAAGVQAVGAAGGIIVNPATPEDFYRNARLHELRNESGAARKAYEAFFRGNPDYVDAYLSYAAILKAQEGIEGARATLAALQRSNPALGLRAAAASLQPREARLAELRRLAADQPDYAPAVYLLSRELSGGNDQGQTWGERREEKPLLAAVLRLHGEGKFLRYLLDQKLAQEWLREAEARTESPMDAMMGSPVMVIANPPVQPFTKEWTVMVFLQEPGAKSGAYRLGTGPFLPLPFDGAAYTLTLPGGDHQLELYYADARGVRQGPFPQTLKEGDQKLMMAKMALKSAGALSASYVPAAITGNSAQVNFRLTFSAHADQIRLIRYGLDRATPDRELPVPPDAAKLAVTSAHRGGPDIIPIPAGTQEIVFQYVFVDDTSSAVFRKTFP